MKLENRKARYDYFIQDTLECGISLKGNEVKSLSMGMANLQGSWCTIMGNQLVLRGLHIKAWDTANCFDIDEDRERVLLVHKKELLKLSFLQKTEGISLIPLRMYFTDKGKCKVELGICRGKKKQDKRQAIKERDLSREN